MAGRFAATPESVHPKKPVEHFGPEASKANKRVVLGKVVGLQYDAELMDRYGRTLAYVWLNNALVNAWLVERGYARTMTIKPRSSRAKERPGAVGRIAETKAAEVLIPGGAGGG